MRCCCLQAGARIQDIGENEGHLTNPHQRVGGIHNWAGVDCHKASESMCWPSLQNLLLLKVSMESCICAHFYDQDIAFLTVNI